MKAITSLSLPEYMLAGFAGVMRHISALQHQRPPSYGISNGGVEPLIAHIGGAAAEMATAKHLDRFWSPLATGRLSDIPGDVSEQIQVRSTPRSDGSLILHPADEDEHLFYLVTTHDLPTCHIHGPIEGKVGKDRCYWRDDRGVRHPAFFIPQDDL